jgi:hypothetical protein
MIAADKIKSEGSAKADALAGKDEFVMRNAGR